MQAFSYCTKLNNVNIGSAVKTIDEYAFSNCASLQSINLKNVDTIGRYAFASCSKLNNIIINAINMNFSEYCFDSCYKLLNVKFDNIRSDVLGNILYNNQTIYNLESLSEVFNNIDDTCINFKSEDPYLDITDDNFVYRKINNELRLMQCLNDLDEYVVPNAVNGYMVTSTANYAFADSEIITRIAFNSGMKILGKYSFYNCVNLESVTLPDTITNIDDRCFAQCEKLQSINMPNSMQRIGDFAFYKCESLPSICINANCRYLGEGAFRFCTSLSNINIENGLQEIGVSAFANCSTLTNISLPKSVQKIENYAFYACTNLQTADLSNLIELGWYSFNKCENLSTLILGTNLTDLGFNTFSECSNISQININKTRSEFCQCRYGMNRAKIYDDDNYICRIFNITNIDIINFNSN